MEIHFWFALRNNTAIVTALRLHPAPSSAHSSYSCGMAQALCPGIHPPFGSCLAHHLHFRHGGYCRSTLITAARLDFNSSNTPLVKHALRFQAHPLPSSHRLTSFPVLFATMAFGTAPQSEARNSPRIEVGDPMMHRTTDYDGNKI